MLATPRPAMDNYQSPDDALPYSLRPIDTDDNIAYSLPLQSPSQSQNPNLDLSNLDNLAGSAAVLENWLDNLSQQPDYHGEGLNFDLGWVNALPPNLMGITSSYGQYGQQQPLPAAWPPGNTAVFPPAHQDHLGLDPLATQAQSLPHYQQPSAPAPSAGAESPIDAAAVLANLGNGHMYTQQRPMISGQPRNIQSQDPSSQRSQLRASLPGSQQSRVPSAHAGPHRPSSSHLVGSGGYSQYRDTAGQAAHYYSPHDDTSPISHQGSNNPDRALNDGTGLFVDMFFGSKVDSSGAPRSAENPDVMRWGSDTNFGSNSRFVPPAGPEYHEPLVEGRPTILNCLQLSQSEANSRPSTPPGNTGRHSRGVRPSSDVHTQGDGVAAKAEPESPQRKPKSKPRGKAQTSTGVGQDDVTTTSLPEKTPVKKRKSKTEAKAPATVPVAPETQKKRRKSAPKPNLTDAQKRSNHIKSEQRRRGAIKEGFADLTELVPDLQTSGLSKSNVLNVAGDWLEALLKGNAELT